MLSSRRVSLSTPHFSRVVFRRAVGTLNYFNTNPTLQIKDATTSEDLKTLAVDTQESIKSKYEEARKYQREWASQPFANRKQVLTKFKDLLNENSEIVAKTLTSETGKPIAQARNEVAGTQTRLNFFLNEVENVIQPSTRRSQSNLNESVRYDSLGVICNISAWNYPLFVGVNVFAPGLLTGNAVLYKPSEHSTLLGLQIQQLLQQAGLPKPLFPVIVGGGSTAEILLEQPIDAVFFTGSNATGSKITKQMASRMIPVQLELGGKDPTYVTDDVDVVKAAKSLADGAMYNAGQSCCSVERIYVHSSVYDKFVEEFVKEVKTYKIEDPKQDSCYIGPLTLGTRQVNFLSSQVSDAVSKGAKILTGGKQAQNGSNYFEPTVLVNVNHTMDVMKYESFGPIIGIQRVNNDEEAIELMNDTLYGLTAGVYANQQKRAEKILSQVNAGTVYWNACDRVSPFLPWSGRKGSGIGSTLGREGILAFVKPKAWHLINP